MSGNLYCVFEIMIAFYHKKKRKRAIILKIITNIAQSILNKYRFSKMIYNCSHYYFISTMTPWGVKFVTSTRQ